VTVHERCLSRRSALVGAVGLAGGTAGCTGDDGDSEGERAGDGSADDGTTAGEPPGGDTTDGDAGGDGGTSEELDLREANVTGVELAEREDGYRVATTLLHDDDGEDGYADWWQVETLDGDRVGRRDLAHPHGTREFTRSTTVAVDADRVVVRGHDRTHGYGGQAALVSVPDGAVELVRQGSEPESFADR
jgi:hypothetical protein